MDFACLSISPIALAHPGVAIATSRAGGIGILDGEFCQAADLNLALKNLDQLLKRVNSVTPVGLRLQVNQIHTHRSLLERLCSRPHWLILSGWVSSLEAGLAQLTTAIATLPSSPFRQLLIEVTQLEQASALEASGVKIDGLVARGHESGGWVGEDFALILIQKLLGKQSFPVYAQGGIGLHTSAACRAAGAAGVVLEEQLWLMPESPLPREWQAHLKNLSGQEAIALGERLESPCRVLSRPGFKAVTELQQLAERIEVQIADPKHAAFQWRQQAAERLGWMSLDSHALPVGQAVGLAAQLRDRFQNTGRLVQAILNTETSHLEPANRQCLLQENAPLACSHRTRYPIVQGPMTRVSDTTGFAEAVSQAGGLPMLALALMRGPQVQTLLQQTQERLGDRSWGIGILGFVPQALREEQLAAVMEVKPPFALIAGGRPDQAAHLEKLGIATYIHVPTPKLLHLFLEQGARRFVFEGRECGGHVGPLSSFVLWESMIEMLLSAVPAEIASEIHILFAGGIHDARSAAMVSALAAPLGEQGMKTGVLMGTAYLFTEEAVACGAILKEFQEVALICSRTRNLETGPGHASRCAVTPFAQEFDQTRRQMLGQRRSPEEIKNTLEDLTLGRLRIASKGLTRGSNGELTIIEADQQRVQGMYMIGQVATLRDQVCTVAELHQDIAIASAELLVKSCRSFQAEEPPQPAPADIAIVGIGTLLPKAHSPETYWTNILTQVNALAEIPPHRWDWRLYYDPDRSARDKVYSKWGGFLEDVAFDPMRFGIPPKSLKSIEPLQLLTLEVVRRALEDAGYASGNFDREHTSVILGAGGGIADLGQQYALRSEIPRFVDAPTQQIWDRLPEWTEESFPGLLLNVAAGRVANRFDLGGSNFTVDAACASSLAAINLAVKELESGRCQVAIAGGIDTVQSPFAYLCFSKTQALTPAEQPRPFDQSADGIVISEGLAVVVLKRLADAERDGDRIYAVIKAVEGSSDGKALGMTAPLPAGQRRAVERVYRKAGFSLNTVGLYEAHGTGTAAGDRAELETITSALVAAEAASKACAIGSVKSLIGHTKCTAGVAGLIKVALALHHKVLPAHKGTETPLQLISEPDSPVYLLKEAHPWLASSTPRRGSVSAFGFGGTNFHAVLEEHLSSVPDQSLGATQWPCELFVWRAETPDALTNELSLLLQALTAGAEPRLRDLAYTYAKQAEDRWQQPVCLSLVAGSLEQLQQDLTLGLAHLQGQQSDPLPSQIQLNCASVTHRSSVQSVAFVFPGQGSQYPDMVREVALYFREIREAIELADQQLQSILPKPLSQYIYPSSAYSPEEEQRNKQLLMDTCIAQPAIGAVEMGFLDLMRRLRLEPAMAGGHSYGEYAALYCAGVLSRQDFLKLSVTRGRMMATACAASDGAMAAVQETLENLQTRLAGMNGVVIANHNAPCQTVISGEKKIVNEMVDNLNAAGVMAKMLPVVGAFHSAFVASAKTALAAAIATTSIQSPKIPVYANATARPYPTDTDSIRSQLTEHLVSPVNFVGQINAMYEEGAQILVEVGPKQILTGLIGQILAGKDHTVVSLNGQSGGLRDFLTALATLSTVGSPLKLTALFEDRDVQLLDLSRLVELTRKPPLPKTAWLVHGGGVRPQTETVAYTGKLPPFTAETAAQATQVLPATEPIAPAIPIAQSTRSPTVSHSQTPRTTPPVAPAAATNSSPSCPQPVPSPSVPASATSAPYQNGRSMNHPEPTGSNSLPTSANSTPLNDSVAMSLLHPRPLMAPEMVLTAYQAYQETMRQFLSVQEQVMKQFLGATSACSPTLAQIPAAGYPGSALLPIVPPTSPSTSPPTSQMPPTPVLNGSSRSQSTISASVMEQPQQLELSPLPAAPLPTGVSAAIAMEALSSESLSTPETNPSLPIAQAITVSTLTQTILQIVGDRTGYPTEMLGLDQDIEAELGIDSIKRVEILGALQKQLPPSLGTAVQAQMESLTRVKSLNGLVNQVLALSPGSQEGDRLGKP